MKFLSILLGTIIFSTSFVYSIFAEQSYNEISSETKPKIEKTRKKVFYGSIILDNTLLDNDTSKFAKMQIKHEKNIYYSKNIRLPHSFKLMLPNINDEKYNLLITFENQELSANFKLFDRPIRHNYSIDINNNGKYFLKRR